ncbi:MAG: radical SAM family heme chaperone HemW [Candidatus Margulisiibacteriota bacterium]
MNGGFYVHIPFCEKSCGYCNFFSFRASEEYEERYVLALKTEIRARRTRELTFDTIYFGGGNPAKLSESAIASILETIRATYSLTKDPEITLEANPENLSEEKLLGLRALGVTRLSIGIQSFDMKNLEMLKRVRECDMSSRVDLALRIFKNVNLDLMYAIPGQDPADIRYNIDNIPEGIKHISWYALSLEKGTMLYKKRLELPWPDESTELAMKELIVKELERKGYRHYEISNYCLPGYESKHNLHYWKYDAYYGLGAGAASTYQGVRVENTSNMKKYFSGNWHENIEKLTDTQVKNEWIMMRLRLKEGVVFEEYRGRFNGDFKEEYSPQMLRHNKFLKIEKHSVALSERGFDLYNEIVSDFFS